MQSGNLSGVGGRSAAIIALSGIWQFPTTDGWVTFNATYGWHYQSHTTAAGSGDTPSESWIPRGIPLPAGTVLKYFWLMGRMGAAGAAGLDAYVRAHEVDAENTDEIDSGAECGSTEVIPSTEIIGTPSAGDMGDLHAGQVDLGDYTMENNAELQIFLKPQGTLSGTATLYYTARLGVELP